ncbi:MAG: hypothetical protein MR779_04630 [Tenericutes bacterium]|nr:hypothetical protein [Mycoplasmatota bacterium]
MKRIKIFYKTDYEYMKEQNAKLNGKIRELKDQIEVGEKQYNDLVEDKETLVDKVNKLTFDFERSTELVDELRDKLFKTEKSLKEVRGAKGGLTKRLNELNNELQAKDKKIEELRIKLEDSMTDKYAVKKIKSGRRPNTLKRSSARPVQSSVQKYQQKLERLEV